MTIFTMTLDDHRIPVNVEQLRIQLNVLMELNGSKPSEELEGLENLLSEMLLIMEKQS